MNIDFNDLDDSLDNPSDTSNNDNKNGGKDDANKSAGGVGLDAPSNNTSSGNASGNGNATSSGNASGNGNATGSGNTPGGIPNLAGGGMLSFDTPFDPTSIMINYNERYKDAVPAKFRSSEVMQTLSILIGLQKPNALLVGPAGVGKTKIVEEIAHLIATKSPIIPSSLEGKTIWELPLYALSIGSGIYGELEKKINAVITYASDPDNNAILFIDEAHMLLHDSTGKRLAQILKPALSRTDLHVIAATTTQEVRSFMDDPAFSRRFTKIIVPELTQEQTCEILKDFAPKYSTALNACVSDDLYEYIVATADEYLGATLHRPDSALTLMDRAITIKIVRSLKIANAMAEKGLDTGNILDAAASPSKADIVATAKYMVSGSQNALTATRKELEDGCASILGQQETVDRIIDITSRYCLNLFKREKPLSMLLAGTSGIGKTAIANAIAKTVMGTKPIVLNMTEYSSPMSVSAIIGSSDGYIGSDSNREMPFDALQSNPYQVILIDEFEKCHPEVNRLFMQILDTGKLRMARGNEIDFSKAIMFFTTNAGCTNTHGITFCDYDGSTYQNVGESILQETFSTELLNRFTHVITMPSLNVETYREILRMNYEKYLPIARQHCANLKLPDTLDSVHEDAFVSNTWREEFGARPAERTIRSYLEDEVMAAQQNAKLKDTDPVD